MHHLKSLALLPEDYYASVVRLRKSSCNSSRHSLKLKVHCMTSTEALKQGLANTCHGNIVHPYACNHLLHKANHGWQQPWHFDEG